jgi:MFS family permease
MYPEARIMITWGLLAAGMALVTGPRSLYLMRFLLGAAEAGFFPGVILYLTYWFPSDYRARIIGMLMVAIPLSSFLGSPISAALLGVDGWLAINRSDPIDRRCDKDHGVVIICANTHSDGRRFHVPHDPLQETFRA